MAPPHPPPRVPSDTVVPLFSMDDTAFNRDILMMFMMRFDNVLDADKLHKSLCELLSRDDWRKLGARLRKNDKGKLEYHIPLHFNEKRPAVTYSHEIRPVNIAEDPFGRHLPTATRTPTVLTSTHELGPLLRGPQAPCSLDDYLAGDLPQLNLHIVSFNDATTVSLSWLHTLFDAMARKALIDNWIAVLEGRHADVQPLVGFSTDPFSTFGQDPSEPWQLAKSKLSRFGMFWFALRYIWEVFIWHRRDESRIVCIPSSTVRALCARARSDLSLPAVTSDASARTPFLSEGDIICGYVSRLIARGLGTPTSSRSVLIMNALGYRSVLGELLPSTHAYVGNAVSTVWAFTSMREMLSLPLAHTAGKIRRSIAEQGTRAQSEARWVGNLAALNKGQTLVFGKPDSLHVLVSNWTKARFFDMDFSAAIVRGEEGNKTRGGGRPSFIQPQYHLSGSLRLRNSCCIIGKDRHGNVWFNANLREGLWPKVQEAMDVEAGLLEEMEKAVAF